MTIIVQTRGQRKRISVQGVVQGVGFRPFIFHLARQLRIGGFVLNSSSGVIIEAEGPSGAIETLIERMRRDKPHLASIDSISIADLSPAGQSTFSIVESVTEPGRFALVSPDVTTCETCSREMEDPLDRRHGYAFINCTGCGPRYTIIRELPYDRASTTMAKFPMCARCEAEYKDPSSRRFHAEANACPDCGPSLDGALDEAIRRLGDGQIVAIKGLGGFHLACDATNDRAVGMLRERKRRSEKPFAVMVADVDIAERFCLLTDADRELLTSRERPIVIVPRREGSTLSDFVAPANRTVGIMLPYTPLHQLLFAGELDVLVMTSGNRSEEPIVTSNVEARRRLAGVADFFLLHDRDIHVRVDDSVARVMEGGPRILRRARSYAPRPIDLGGAVPEIVATGAELKNAFCLTKERFAILSQHIGDLSNYETLAFFEQTIGHLATLFHVSPIAVAHDLHPLYMSTRFAQRSGLPAIGVQHHHAHIASCMAENGILDRVIGVAMDGTGYGIDGTIWGGEFLVCDLHAFERRAHLRSVPLAGGDAAIRQPWRSAVSYLRDAAVARELPVIPAQRKLVEDMLDRRLNVFETTSCGRLFDAVASILGLRQEISFEAQAAIDVEMAADAAVTDAYPYVIRDQELDFRPTIEAIARERVVSIAAARFHNTLANAIAEVCENIRQTDRLDRVCLSGGVFQNALLLTRTAARLRRFGFDVILHSRVPCNDGGIALGQAVIAAERLRRGDV